MTMDGLPHTADIQRMGGAETALDLIEIHEMVSIGRVAGHSDTLIITYADHPNTRSPAHAQRFRRSRNCWPHHDS